MKAARSQPLTMLWLRSTLTATTHQSVSWRRIRSMTVLWWDDTARRETRTWPAWLTREDSVTWSSSKCVALIVHKVKIHCSYADKPSIAFYLFFSGLQWELIIQEWSSISGTTERPRALGERVRRKQPLQKTTHWPGQQFLWRLTWSGADRWCY